jgi:transketolase
MRNTIVNLILEEAKINSNVFFLTGDLGYSVIESFQKDLPNQCLNLGIAEQNMMGVAAGLALEGKKVFVYSIIPFVTLRCLEQIKIDVALHNADVTIIGTGSGFAYGTLGPTHYSIEELGAMRAIPRLKILAPSDPISSKVLGEQIIKIGGPTYVRLNRGGEPVLYQQPPAMEFGKGFVAKSGTDVCILSNGAITQTAFIVAQDLDKANISTEVVDMATVKPLDVELIKNRLACRKLVVTLEEHNILGGFGSAVAEVAAENPRAAAFKRIGINDCYPEVYGKQEFMRDINNLSEHKVFLIIKNLYERL